MGGNSGRKVMPARYSYLEYDEKIFRHKRVSSNEGSDRVNQPLEQFWKVNWLPVRMTSLTYVANIRMFGSGITPEEVREMTGSKTAA